MDARDCLSGVYLDNHKFSKSETIKLMEDYYNYRVEHERQNQLRKSLISAIVKQRDQFIAFANFAKSYQSNRKVEKAWEQWIQKK